MEPEKITGYRNLTPNEIALINEVKALAELCGEMVERLKASELALDNRWVAIGNTDLQTGFMALVRSISRPTTF